MMTGLKNLFWDACLGFTGFALAYGIFTVENRYLS